MSESRPLPLRTELVGPDALDIAGWLPRQIMSHALDVALWTRHEIKALRGGLHAELEIIKGRLRLVEAVPSAPDVRAQETSWHDYDGAIASMRADLSAKIRDPHHPISEASALRLIEAEALRVKLATAAGRWERLAGLLPIIAKEALKAVVAAAVGGGGVLLWHLLQAAGK